MHKARLRRTETLLAKLRAKTSSLCDGVIVMHGETEKERNADMDRQIAAARVKGYMGSFIILPEPKPPPLGEASAKEALSNTQNTSLN